MQCYRLQGEIRLEAVTGMIPCAAALVGCVGTPWNLAFQSWCLAIKIVQQLAK